jgi:hypothetical protein
MKRKTKVHPLGKANAKMHDITNRVFGDYIAYNLRRAAEERSKAAETGSEPVRRCRIEIAEMFEARADAAPALFGCPPTLH